MVRSIESGHETGLGHISPVHKLPRELQTKIIKNALKSELQPAYSISFCDEDPSLQTHPVFEVCRLWRQLAFDTPEIWSAIEIRGNLLNRNLNQDRKLRGLQRWLERGRNFPLDIRFAVGDDASLAVTSDHVSGLWNLLLAQPRRWRSLDYKGTWAEYFDAVMKRTTEFILLSTLSVSYRAGFSKLNEPAATFPNLRALHLTSMAVQLPIEGSSLVKLVLTWVGPTLANISHYAKRFPNIRHLVTHESDVFYFKDDPVDGELFSHLRSWEWKLQTALHAGVIAQCPKLDALQLEFVRKLQFLPEIPLLPSITKLTLVDGSRLRRDATEGPDYEELLQRTPNLRDLKFCAHESARAAIELVELFIRKDASPLLCPQLQSMTLERVTLRTDSLLQFLKERMAHPACRITTIQCFPIPDMQSVLYTPNTTRSESTQILGNAREKSSRVTRLQYCNLETTSGRRVPGAVSSA